MKNKRVAALLIAASNGYLPPQAAGQIINDYRRSQGNYCEWFIEWSYREKKPVAQVTKEFVQHAIKRRAAIQKYGDYRRALAVLEWSMKHPDAVAFASWM